MAGPRRRSALLAAVALVAAVAGGCSDGDDGSSDASPSATSTEAAPTAAPAVFDGPVEDFYVPPDPLPDGEPGDLLRTQVVGTEGEVETVRIMYLSQDATEALRAVTGVATYPDGPAPDGGRTVVSTGHGTTGIASQCAPSRAGGAAPTWGLDDVVAVQTDYVGLGPPGELHPYLSKPSEGNAVIDAVRAVGQLPEAGAGDRWVAAGHSQGGHGALAAMELGPARAPELDLVATVALSPAALFDRVYGGIDPVVTTILTMMGMYGGRSEHPEIDLADHLTDEALAAAEVFETECLDGITEALVPVALGGAFTADPRRTEPTRSILLANDVGGTAVEGVPLYLASGTADDRVVIERVRDLFDRLCASAQTTELQVVEGADHGSIIPATADRVTSFLETALAGDPPVDSCAG